MFDAFSALSADIVPLYRWNLWWVRWMLNCLHCMGCGNVDYSPLPSADFMLRTGHYTYCTCVHNEK